MILLQYAYGKIHADNAIEEMRKTRKSKSKLKAATTPRAEVCRRGGSKVKETEVVSEGEERGRIGKKGEEGDNIFYLEDTRDDSQGWSHVLTKVSRQN